MSLDQDRAKFIHVYDLMTDIAQGIGDGHNRLVRAAQTNYGSLAVKNAEVEVQFVLSSSAQAVGLAAPGLGANTLFGIGTTKDENSSRATVKLTIVPIPITDALPALPPRTPTLDPSDPMALF